jgi:hypothetical protein
VNAAAKVFTERANLFYFGNEKRGMQVMKKIARLRGLFWGAVALAVLADGCSTSKYYCVTDPASSKVYYTPRVQKDKKTGVVSFVDAASGVQITLPKSTVKQIDRNRFNEGLHGK